MLHGGSREHLTRFGTRRDSQRGGDDEGVARGGFFYVCCRLARFGASLRRRGPSGNAPSLFTFSKKCRQRWRLASIEQHARDYHNRGFEDTIGCGHRVVYDCVWRRMGKKGSLNRLTWLTEDWRQRGDCFVLKLFWVETEWTVVLMNCCSSNEWCKGQNLPIHTI